MGQSFRHKSSTLFEIVKARASEAPSGTAFLVEPQLEESHRLRGLQAVSWREYLDCVSFVAEELSLLGVREGATVGVVLDNHFLAEVVDKALFLLKCTPVPLDLKLLIPILGHELGQRPDEKRDSSPFLDFLLSGSEPPFSSLSLQTKVNGGENAKRAESRGSFRFQAFGCSSVMHLFAEKCFLEEGSSFGKGTEKGREYASAPLFVSFTSGSTGSPKMRSFSLPQLYTAVDSILEALPLLGAQDKTISWLPLTGLYQRVFNAVSLISGATTVCLNSPRDVVTQLHEFDPTWMIGVPQLYNKLRHLPAAQLARVLNGSLRFMVTGSAPISPATVQFFWDAGVPLLEAYGVSECIIPLCFNTVEKHRIGSVGPVLQPNKVRIQEGRIVVQSPGLAREIAEDTDFVSEDFGRFDDEEYLYLCGRNTEQVKLNNGRWISLKEVEEQYSSVASHSVAFATLECEGELVGVAFLENSTSDEFHSLLRELFRHVPEYMKVSRWKLLSRAPSPTNGEITRTLKLRRSSLRRLFDGAEGEEIEILPTHSKVSVRIQSTESIRTNI